MAPLIEVRTEGPAHGGSCIAHADGRPLFVHHSLPGELVRAEPRGRRGGAAFAAAVEVLEASADRVAPRCGHFGVCGGCHWQHAAYARQLQIKREIVASAWERSGLRLPPDTPVVGMDDPWRYRIRGEFEAVRYGEETRFGLHRLRSHAIFGIETCPIHDQRIERAVLAFGQAVTDLGLEGAQTLTLTAEPTGAGLLWRLTFRGDPRRRPPERLAELVADRLENVALLDDAMTLEFWDLSFRVRSDTFVQTNYRQMTVLYELALEMLRAGSSDRVLDLYSGIGTIAMSVARQAAAVTAVEENPRAVQLAALAARINGVRNVHLLPGQVETVLRQVRLGDHDAAILDPPRAGCAPEALAELLRLQPGRVVYVSCEPSTHARDLAALVRGGYRVRRAAVVDMFPQTYHIESVALLERSAA